MRKYREYSDQQIIEFSKNVKSIAGLLRKLDLNPYGSNYQTIKKKLFELKIDTSHWTGQAWCKNQQLKNWEDYRNPNSIKKHLILKSNNICQKCGLKEWLNNPIPLEMHHIDGNSTNNKLENLEILCPNCHALTPNWRGRANVEKTLDKSETVC